MLPYSVKLVWMISSTIGTVCSWPVLYGLAKSINTWWIPVTYGSACTILVLLFDIGAIWKMNPSEFPPSFCLTQVVGTNLTVFVLMGICVAYNVATIRCALWPEYGKVGLQWDNTYLILLVALPISSTALQMGLANKFGALEQIGFDNTFCDITEPLWPKLLGWGGLPMIYTLASFVFTAFAVMRLQIMLEVHNKLWHDMSNQVEFAPRPPTDRKDVTRAQTLHPDALAEREAMRRGLLSLSLDYVRAGDIEMKTVGPSSSSRAASLSPYGSTENMTNEGSERTVFTSPTPLPPLIPPPKLLPVDGDVSMYGTAPVARTAALPPPPTSLLAEIWRLLLFQAAFITIGTLLTVSTLYSLSGHRRPREFGSDHIAVIGAAWGPVFVFGHVPSIRKRLMFWK
ncbi:hypothetical protein FIBSPDRAFT_883605 [Athelia psychrophila]|uniref:Uncharacterized protein n=1 Tax=Athelia psychrophila TaxID=1759441 RepID=A0A166U752_9AGAM|nr:hypothetical protein FIBSPDRAFT_883605 [Fibularhizoctonia sp. CBS 109695]